MRPDRNAPHGDDAPDTDGALDGFMAATLAMDVGGECRAEANAED